MPITRPANTTTPSPPRSATSTLHPGSPDAAYAQYLIGSSYYDQIPDVTRDQAPHRKGDAALEEVIRKYPNTEYAASAKKKLEVARDQLAGKEMMIGRYYLEQAATITGAINRFKTGGDALSDHAPCRGSAGAPDREPIWRSASCGRRRPPRPCSGTTSRTASWYKDAYKLVQSGGLEPRENKGSWISKLFQPKPAAEARRRTCVPISVRSPIEPNNCPVKASPHARIRHCRPLCSKCAACTCRGHEDHRMLAVCRSATSS